MTTADAEAIARLTTQLGYPAQTPEIERRFAELRDRPSEAVLVAADVEDRAIGWIHVARVALLEASDMALIGGLVVDDAHRSSRIGAELVAAAESWAREHGCRSMTVRSRVTRARAHRFYEREGYRQVKTSHVFEKSLV